MLPNDEPFVPDGFNINLPSAESPAKVSQEVALYYMSSYNYNYMPMKTIKSKHVQNGRHLAPENNM